MYYLGIDTSNYKTSMALINESGKVLFDKSEFLEVPLGRKGLRQSDAFFAHSNRLPDYIAEVSGCINTSEILAIGVSSRPRRVEGSYMPCFLAGVNAAREIGAVLGIHVHEFSHQEGHAAAVIMDGLHDSPASADNGSLLFHLSGGTTEFLLCTEDDAGYDMEIVGGTKDISIGQLIDRTGVAMGLPFPSGSYLDAVANEYEGSQSYELGYVRTKDGYFNLSGPETRLLRYIECQIADGRPLVWQDSDDNKISYTTEGGAVVLELFGLITDLLAKSAVYLADKYHIRRIYVAGGVASSQYVRREIVDKVSKFNSHNVRNGSKIRSNGTFADTNAAEIDIIFGKPELSGDNAVGIARLTARQYI